MTLLEERGIENRKVIAQTFLELANNSYQEQKLHRGYYARIAYEHGLTYTEIGAAYGISDVAARGLVKRAAR